MRKYLHYVKDNLMNIPVRITWNVAGDSAPSREVVGTITELEWDDVHGGYIVIEPDATESARLMVKRANFNLSSIIIWDVSPLLDGYDTKHYFDCPHCKKTIALGLKGAEDVQTETEEEEE